MADRLADVQPPELAAVLDLAERPRVGGWSLRSALTRYAQPEPRRVSELLDLVRRIDVVLPGLVDEAVADGPGLWASAQGDETSFEAGLVRTMVEIDGLADRLAAWADQWSLDRPDDDFDAVVADVRQRLEALGVPEQEQRPGPGRGGRG